MGRRSKATNTRAQNLSRRFTAAVKEVDDEEADLELDDILAQLGIEILPDMDGDEEED